MNKKLAVLLVVPILIAMGGTFAFSAFSGSSSVTVNGTAGNLAWNETGMMVYTNANNTPLTLLGPNGVPIEIGSAEPYAAYTPNLSLGYINMNTSNSGKEYKISVTNLVPGEYVELNISVINTGSVGFMVVPTPSTYKLATSSDSTYNSGDATIAATNVTSSAFMTALQNDTGYVYNVVGTHMGTSLSPMGTAYATIMIGLGNSNGNDVNYYQGSDISMDMTFNIVSDP